MELKEKIKSAYWLQSILNSYSLIFFSSNNIFALCIIIVTFFTPFVGACGLFAIVLINSLASLLGFSREEIKNGLFGFNALFVGMFLGYQFNLNIPFVVFFLSAIIVLLLITIWLKNLLAIHKLPFLVLPFIITSWVLSLSVTNFEHIILNENHVYTINTAVKNQSSVFYNFIHSLDNLKQFPFIITFFKTLAGTFFQTSVLGGIIIALGLIQFSRIAFSLSLLGFASAYFFYFIFGVDVIHLNHYLSGINFIFMSIAIGGFFVIPSRYSYLAVIVLTPVVLLASLALTKILWIFKIRPYSLSFSLVTIGFLFALNQRLFSNYLQIVTIQYFSPEKTIYKFLTSIHRFKNEHLYKLALPFSGEWNVSQGYDGDITHLGEWSKALDFVIVDETSKTHSLPLNAREGFGKENFYCYNQPVYAPYDGYVYNIINTVEENDIGDMDTKNNWGNTIIINHLNGLYSQISHLKKDSLETYIGQYITKGTYIGKCGNSGRSPEPHIHFQLQTEPSVGAKTYPYPISYFIEREGNIKKLKISEVPKENTFISNVVVNELLSASYNLLPGQNLILIEENTGKETHWKVLTDALNRTHIYCEKTKSYAYFNNDDVMFYFTDFEGDKASLLFQFYLAAYRQLLGFYDGVEVVDKVPLIHFNNKVILFIQDFIAPFVLLTKADYTSRFTFSDNEYSPQNIVVSTGVVAKFLKYSLKKYDYKIALKNYQLDQFTIQYKNKSEKYTFKKSN